MSWNRLKRTVAPSAKPISLAELNAWLRLDLAEEDPLVDQLIQDAVDFIEGPHGIGLVLMPQTWELPLDDFPSGIKLELGPVRSVDSITYIDVNGTEQTLAAADYQVDMHSQPSLILPAYGASWPAVREVMNAVVVTFQAGFDTVPGDLKRALALLAGHWHANREAVVIGSTATELPLSVESILNKYRVGRVA